MALLASLQYDRRCKFLLIFRQKLPTFKCLEGELFDLLFDDEDVLLVQQIIREQEPIRQVIVQEGHECGDLHVEFKLPQYLTLHALILLFGVGGVCVFLKPRVVRDLPIELDCFGSHHHTGAGVEVHTLLVGFLVLW